MTARFIDPPSSPEAVSVAGLPKPRRYLAIISLTMGSLFLVVDASIAGVALPTIARELHVVEARAVSLVTLYQLVLAMTIISFSALGDRLGQRRIYRSGLLVHSACSVACLVAHSLLWLLVIRGLQALSAAAALSVTFGLVRAIYPPSQLGRGLGLNTLASAGGGALAPLVGGLILTILPWRWIFVVGSPLALLSCLLGGSLPPGETHRESFDLGGAALCALTLGLTIFGLGQTVHGGVSLTPWLALGCGVVAGAAFVIYERRPIHPVLPLDLLSRPAFCLSVAGSLIGVVGSTLMLLWAPFRLQRAFGFGPAETGALVAPYALASLMIAPLSGIMSDRISPRLLGSIGLLIAVAALVSLAFLPTHPSVFGIGLRMWTCGAGFGMFFSPNARVIFAAAPPHRAAASGGLVTTTRMLGQALGATLLATLLVLGGGLGSAPPLLAALLTVVAAACALARPREKRLQTSAAES